MLTARAKEKTIHSVAFDTLPEYMDRMRAGYVDVLLGQKLFGWGYDTVMLAYNLATTDRQVSAFTDAGWYVVCPNNLEEFERNTQAMKETTGRPCRSAACSLSPALLSPAGRVRDAPRDRRMRG